MVEIRQSSQEDISYIIDFQSRMAIETEGFELDPSIVAKGVNAVLNDPVKGFYIVAMKNDKVIACLMLTPEWSDWRNGYFLWIQSLFVEPQYRAAGIFRKMFDFVIKLIAASDDYLGIRLYVDLNNTIAQDVYVKVGMKESHYKMFEWIK